MGAKDTVEQAISGNKVVVFSKSWCPYCARAKQLLNSLLPEPPKVYELDEIEEGSEIQAYLKEKTGQSSVPNIFINQEHIGGNDKLQELNSQGQLEKKLKNKARL